MATINYKEDISNYADYCRKQVDRYKSGEIEFHQLPGKVIADMDLRYPLIFEEGDFDEF
jgi:hypothetical protein